jgi:septal ring factor EnvC (AmiA/AmiB activator)
MRRLTAIFALATFFAVVGAPTHAQQPPDPAFVQKALAALQQQRNAAMDNLAVVQAQLAQAQEQLQAVTKERDDLKAKLPKDEPKQ